MRHQAFIAPPLGPVPDREKLSGLNKLGVEVSRIFSGAGMCIEKRFAHMLDAGCEAFEADRGFVTICDPGKVKLRYANTAFAGQLPQVSHDPLSTWIVKHRRPLTIDGVASADIQELCNDQDQPPARFIGAPIVFDGQVFGTLEFSGMQTDLPTFGQMDIAMIQMLCVITAAPILLLAMS